MPTAGECLAGTEPHHWIFRRDLAKAFLQLTMDPADVLDMGFVDPFSGEVLCFRAPMFGLAAAPRFLHLAVQTSVRAIATVLRALAIRLHDTDPTRAQELLDVATNLFAYADDFFWAGTPFAATAAHLIVTLEGGAFGWSFDPGKDILGRIIVVLGRELNAPGQCMRVSPARAQLYAASINIPV